MTYIHNLSSVLGEDCTTASLKAEGISRERILQLLVRGATGYRRHKDTLLSVAIEAAETTLKKTKYVDRNSIDVLLLGTNSMRAPDFESDFGHALITRLRLNNAYIQLVGFQNCGDSVPILSTARALLKSGAADNILVLIADDVTGAGIPRIVKDSYLHSDGAVAGLVSKQGPGFHLGLSKVFHAPPIDQAIDLYDLEANLQYLLEKALYASIQLRDEDGGPEFVITHNMNSIFNQRVADTFQLPISKVYGYVGLGHCLAADVLINMSCMELENKLSDNERGIVVVPTSRSVGLMNIKYVAHKNALDWQDTVSTVGEIRG